MLKSTLDDLRQASKWVNMGFKCLDRSLSVTKRLCSGPAPGGYCQGHLQDAAELPILSHLTEMERWRTVDRLLVAPVAQTMQGRAIHSRGR